MYLNKPLEKVSPRTELVILSPFISFIICFSLLFEKEARLSPSLFLSFFSKSSDFL